MKVGWPEMTLRQDAERVRAVRNVVGPDVGTAASLFAAALHPGRFRSLVVGTGGTAVPLQLGDPLKGAHHHICSAGWYDPRCRHPTIRQTQ